MVGLGTIAAVHVRRLVALVVDPPPSYDPLRDAEELALPGGLSAQ